MRALVIYESMFGNTHRVAEAIAAGLGEHMAVEVLPVDRAPSRIPSDVDLVVAGGPTHAFGMTRAATRHAATEQAGAEQPGAEQPGTTTPESTGIREWLAELERGTTAVATFDTRIKKRGLPGSAARGAQRRLRRLGYRPAIAAGSFWVSDTPGPLHEGEEARARQWGTELAADVRHRATTDG